MHTRSRISILQVSRRVTAQQRTYSWTGQGRAGQIITMHVSCRITAQQRTHGWIGQDKSLERKMGTFTGIFDKF